MDTTAAPTTRPRRRWLVAVAVVVIVLVILVAVLGRSLLKGDAPLGPLEAIPAGSLVAVPPTRPVVLIVLENKNERAILGAADAPYFNSLVAAGAVSTDYQAVTHPSQPNYIALFSGSTQGVTDDGVHDLQAPNLADQLEAAGLTWRMFAENLPAGDCYTGDRSSGGPDGDGTYARKHVPAISFTSISGSTTRCANIQPLGAFKPDAADFSWVVPNLCHDMHDCSIAQGDAWLASFVPKVLGSPAFGPGGTGVLYITFDETDGGRPNNEIATLALGPGITPGTRTDVAHTHYSLLRTIETGLGLPCLAKACGANTLGEVFGATPASPAPSAH